MAKGGNPAAAERKRLEKKQQAKNKEQKAKAQETATVKKDTRGLEQRIKELQDKAAKAPLAKADKEELESLRAELDRVKSVKDAYIEQHPEHKKFVYPHNQEPKAGSDVPTRPARTEAVAPVFGKNGLPRYPERSVYYDPVFNPTGVAPPGMPYREKPPHEWTGSSAQALREEAESQDEDEDEDDIVMPEGPPPDSDSDTDSGLEDVMLPEGPPPPKPPTGPKAMSNRRAGPSRAAPNAFRPPPTDLPVYSGPPPGAYSSPPPGFPMHVPPPGYGLPGVYMGPPPPMHPMHPQGFPARPPHRNQGSRPHISANAVMISASATVNARPPAPSPAASAMIEAAPQIRDLKREATAFVPAAVRKKKATDQARAAMGLPDVKKVNAAPGEI